MMKLLLIGLFDFRHGRVHALGVGLEIESCAALLSVGTRRLELIMLSLRVRGVEDQLAGLGELELGDELLDEVVTLFDQALVGLV